jgi:hypothetical protein
MSVRCPEGRSSFKGRGLGRAPLAGPIFRERRFRVRRDAMGGRARAGRLALAEPSGTRLISLPGYL